MPQIVKLIALLFFPTIAGCYQNIKDEPASPDQQFFGLYTSYISDIQSERFPANIEDHFSRQVIDELKDANGGKTITTDDVGSLVMSSFMPINSIKNHYAEKETEKSACFTATGLSHDQHPMYVNIEYVLQDHNWRINKLAGHAFYDGTEPVFPTKATCPKMAHKP